MTSLKAECTIKMYFQTSRNFKKFQKTKFETKNIKIFLFKK